MRSSLGNTVIKTVQHGEWTSLLRSRLHAVVLLSHPRSFELEVQISFSRRRITRYIHHRASITLQLRNILLLSRAVMILHAVRTHGQMYYCSFSMMVCNCALILPPFFTDVPICNLRAHYQKRGDPEHLVLLLWVGPGEWGGWGGCGVFRPGPISLKLYTHMPYRVISTCIKLQKMPHPY